MLWAFMRTAHHVVAALAALSVLLAAAPSGAQLTPARAVPAYVSRVIDGDTVYVVIGDRPETVRYIGVVTPEMHHPTLGREPDGEAAYALNQRLVDGKWVWLVFDVEQRDRYGRLLAYVWVDGRLVNAELLRLGYAQAATTPPNLRHADYFDSLEREAREQSRGLWARVQAPTLPRLKSEATEAATGTAHGRIFSAPAPRPAPLLKSDRQDPRPRVP
jgi:micrococcal nuclease